ncbi:Ribosomal protein L2 [Quillaja saponaria]|uniref:Ribosomal protein L2 n=1 Tax=Quillaja saponaria TaxID=32244 RepID=A0AAD7LDB3_QUISA|nr:Ribosomal protein L2 [Quillaja saponaria]
MKRLHRRLDLKRSTSSTGIVESIEYDPNRTSRIAAVRWIEGLQRRHRECNTVEEVEPTTTTIRGGLFSFSSLPGKVDRRKDVACFSPGLMAAYKMLGGAGRSDKSCAKDVFSSAFSSPKAKGETASPTLSFSSSFGIPVAAVFEPRMKERITSLLVLKFGTEGSDPVILANAADVSHSEYFQRSSFKEFIVFVGRTIAKRTPQGQCQSLLYQEYKVHAYNRNGLCALGFMDNHYPVGNAFSLLNQVLDEFQKDFGDSWRSTQADSTQPWPYLNKALTKFQHDTIDSVLV